MLACELNKFIKSFDSNNLISQLFYQFALSSYILVKLYFHSHFSARSSLSISQNNYVPCARTSGSCPRPYAGYKSSDVHMSYDTDYRRISSDCQPYNDFQNHFVRKSQIKARQEQFSYAFARVLIYKLVT